VSRPRSLPAAARRLPADASREDHRQLLRVALELAAAKAVDDELPPSVRTTYLVEVRRLTELLDAWRAEDASEAPAARDWSSVTIQAV
jgi:hypothetical protein